ncbi:MAG: hypothetical protein KBD29_00585, partial [Candidatus Magasanikbacteria bacterium]|nr:hypothetical protein [Candidatus Magasanikbacteria bacterium]
MSEKIKISPSSFGTSSHIPSRRLLEGRFLFYWSWRTLVYEYLTLRRSPSAQKDPQELAKLRKQIFLTYFKNFLWFPVLFLKLLTPSYMKGEVNVWT